MCVTPVAMCLQAYTELNKSCHEHCSKAPELWDTFWHTLFPALGLVHHSQQSIVNRLHLLPPAMMLEVGIICLSVPVSSRFVKCPLSTQTLKTVCGCYISEIS